MKSSFSRVFGSPPLQSLVGPLIAEEATLERLINAHTRGDVHEILSLVGELAEARAKAVKVLAQLQGVKG